MKATTTSILRETDGTESSPSARQPLTLPGVLGLVVALAGPPVYSLVAPRLLKPLVDPVAYALSGMLVMWLLAGSVVLIVRVWERQPLTAIGLRPLNWRMALLAIVIGMACSLAVPVLTVLVRRMLPAARGGTVDDVVTQMPAWVILCAVLTAACAEEVLYRGYAIERLARLTGSVWPAAIITLTLFVVQHLGGWSLSHVVGVVLPIGALVTGLYLWRRNLLFVVLIHFMTDLPLFLLAAGVLPPIS